MPRPRDLSDADLEARRHALIRDGDRAGYHSPALARVRRALRVVAAEQTRRADRDRQT